MLMANISNEIMLAKDFITYFDEICIIIITYRNKDNSILREQKNEPPADDYRSYCTNPNETAIRIRILPEAIPNFIHIAGFEILFGSSESKVVMIHKVIASIIRVGGRYKSSSPYPYMSVARV